MSERFERLERTSSRDQSVQSCVPLLGTSSVLREGTADTARARPWHTRGLFVVALFAAFGFLPASGGWRLNAAEPRESQTGAEAREILAATGVQGGLVVHVGCGDGRLTAALRVGDGYLVHGLDTNAERVEQARRHLQSRGLYGAVSMDRFDGKRLPYVDNLVNLVVAEDLGEVEMDEILRVLSPGGRAYVKSGGQWRVTVKPWPAAIDQWTHFLHGPDNNAVAHDTVVDSPSRVQWVGGPKWARHHNHLSSTSAVVTSTGRLFAIVDEGPIASLVQPPEWRLVARDAFNGVVLWKRPIGPWEGHLRPFRSGPPDIARRLVAVGNRAYVTLGYGKPVVALDAASGELVSSYSETEGATEILYDGGVLYVVVGTIDPQLYAASRRRGAASPPSREKLLLAVEAESGKVLWEKSDSQTANLLPTTLCVGGGRAFFQNADHVVCLDANTGDVRWQAPRPVRMNRRSWSTPTLVVHQGVVLSADCAAEREASERAADGRRIQWAVTSGPKRGEASLGELIALSAADGKELWRCPTSQGYTAPADLFVAAGLVWGSASEEHNTTGFHEGRDLHTGEVKRRVETARAFDAAHHHRCYRNKATDRFVVLGRTGVELIDLSGAKEAGRAVRHCWVRGGCQYGVMPANGLLYTPPHSCGCYIQSKLSGFWALAPKRQDDATFSNQTTPALEPGPAYDSITNHESSIINHKSTSPAWPTHRHDPARSGRSSSKVPDALARMWHTELAGRLTAPVIAEGKLLVAAVDAHTVHALDADGGQQVWHYTAGGRIDSPPTIHRGLAVFGCRDGFVYCLRLADGELVWRRRAAPADRRTVAFGQIESVWPVIGSVMVVDDVLWYTAGRSSFLDGGMILGRLDPATGKLIDRTRLYSRDPNTGEQPEAIMEDVELPGALPDVLVCDGQHVFLRDKVLDLSGVEQPKTHLPHVYCSAGLLDDTWWHRTYWLWGERTWGRASGWGVIPNFRPSGRILTTDQDTVFGYGRKSVRGNSLQGYHLFRADKQVEEIDKQLANNNAALAKYQRPAKVTYHWTRQVPLVVRAMVLTPERLLAAGPVMAIDPTGGREPAFDADAAAVLESFDTEDGRDVLRLELEAQPVFDGMAVAGKRLYMSTTAGTVVCYGEE